MESLANPAPGKSTLAKMITRLTDITDGTLKFQGKDITKLKQSQLRDVYGNIQMVFQNPTGSFDPRRTLGDGIGESLRNRGMKKADIAIRVKELLEQCGLEEELAKDIHMRSVEDSARELQLQGHWQWNRRC